MQRPMLSFLNFFAQKRPTHCAQARCPKSRSQLLPSIHAHPNLERIFDQLPPRISRHRIAACVFAYCAINTVSGRTGRSYAAESAPSASSGGSDRTRTESTISRHVSSTSIGGDAELTGSASASECFSQLLHTPPFRVGAERFDLSTYAGRALHFLTLLGDLTTLFASTEEICDAEKLLLRHASGEETGASDRELWRAQKLVRSAVHPESGVIIPSPFRFTAFAPANLVICAGLLHPGAGLVSTAFFQWLNQSYNAAVNWCNRSSGEASAQTVAVAYVAATSTALGIGVGFSAMGKRFGQGGALVRLTVPMLAVTASSVVNLLLTRRHELEGVPVTAADGTCVGESAAAGRVGLAKCAATRVIWTFLLLTVAPLTSRFALRLLPSKLASQAVATRVVDLSVLFGVIWISVPLSIAVWPQRASIRVGELEESLQDIIHPITGEKVHVVYFNRGL